MEESISTCEKEQLIEGVDKETFEQIAVANIIDVDYIDTKIRKFKCDLQSDINTTKGMKLFFGLGALFLGFEVFTTYFNWNKILSILFFFLFFLVFAVSFSTSKQEQLKAEIEDLEQKKKNMTKVKGIPNTSQHFDTLVSININNLEEYYNLVKKSNKRSFNVSIVMSIIGIFLIMSGMIYSYFITEVQRISYLISASGIVTEMIAGLLFYLYNRSVIQLKEYHDSLIDVQNVLLSFKLIDDLKNEENKSNIMKQLIEFLVKRNK